MFSGSDLSNVLRAVSGALQTPVIFILILLAAVTVISAGTLIAELFTERLHMKAKLPALINRLRENGKDVEDTVKESGLLGRQKKALLELAAQKKLSAPMQQSLASDMLYKEKTHYDLRVKVTDLIIKLAPMFGLLGTLIPLGPGIIALGRGDTYTLSLSLLTAFDTTVAGLITAAAACVVSAVRKHWYGIYMTTLETVMECLLEVLESDAE
jgi:biopolymer transport protein ExbB/TolQ